jgi:hypothetical protein
VDGLRQRLVHVDLPGCAGGIDAKAARPDSSLHHVRERCLHMSQSLRLEIGKKEVKENSRAHCRGIRGSLTKSVPHGSYQNTYKRLSAFHQCFPCPAIDDVLPGVLPLMPGPLKETNPVRTTPLGGTNPFHRIFRSRSSPCRSPNGARGPPGFRPGRLAPLARRGDRPVDRVLDPGVQLRLDLVRCEHGLQLIRTDSVDSN